jgi:hypothetical protein
MALGLSSTVRNNRLTQILNAIDGGTGAGTLKIYDGTRPATGGTATNLLATLTFSDPCGTVSGGVLTFSAITSGTGTAAAGAGTTATWGRIADSAGTFVTDCSVGTSGADINLNSTNIVQNATVSVTSGSITEGNA